MPDKVIGTLRAAVERGEAMSRPAMSRPGSKLMLAIVSAAAAGAPMAANAAECSIPQRNRAAILAGIERSTSCAGAQEILQACSSGTSGDIALSNAVVAKCESLFKAQLSPVDRKEYERQKKSCATRNAGERGTESVSLAARCKAGVAADFAK